MRKNDEMIIVCIRVFLFFAVFMGRGALFYETGSSRANWIRSQKVRTGWVSLLNPTYKRESLISS